MIYHSGLFRIFAKSIRFLQGNGYICITEILYKHLIISSFARSITDVSIETRYICVVAMESWPSASEMTLTGTFFDLAMVAQACLLTYVVSGIGNFNISAMIFKALFTRRKAASYCLRSSQSERVMTGSR